MRIPNRRVFHACAANLETLHRRVPGNPSCGRGRADQAPAKSGHRTGRACPALKSPRMDKSLEVAASFQEQVVSIVKRSDLTTSWRILGSLGPIQQAHSLEPRAPLARFFGTTRAIRPRATAYCSSPRPRIVATGVSEFMRNRFGGSAVNQQANAGSTPAAPIRSLHRVSTAAAGQGPTRLCLALSGTFQIRCG